MNLSYTILYVQNVVRSVEFHEKAFGLTRRFVSDEKLYAEMETGATTLSFSANEFMRSNLGHSFTENDPTRPPAGFEIAFTTPDVPAAYAQAVQQGATPVHGPITKPWGQTVAYVRDLDGILVEIASPMS
jgi:catechol 2,3-dioxygenase-like lactoylglutathione lyase family enzyme